ncbi:phosphodiester glycosidase family protein [Candidatus Berkiella cookevillensis]|uniref:IQ calmodulin-binding motif protein n=1 Tax=Candidatus Berkiella cookevillensis TaxID=437022 RepID=A0A0Q9YND7_9GAMM|nr:phosphodiester glycosidase family protein [Candidatus Berkiella cookevillensis]MCS5708081.1 phosphodiester glycosidase family protein [Candidatus Berkiella cookevillensis]
MLDSLSSITKVQKTIRNYLAEKKILSATIEIQKIIRGYLLRKKIRIKTIGPGIVNTHIKMQRPSELLGEKFQPFDNMRSGFEIMLTSIDPSQAEVGLVTDQGTPDHLMKYLKQENATYGAMINGGFYAINGFYHLTHNVVIGLHRYEKNYLASKKTYYSLGKKYDNTSAFFQHTEDSVSEKFEGYEQHTEIESQLHLKTQLPSSVREEYGIIRINYDGIIDIQSLSSFQSAEAFDTYQKSAKYLLSSGPILVQNNQVVFTEDKLKDKRFQFDVVKKVFGTHPGSVPPGSFYHADQPNPRSAIGLTKKGQILMVTLKGDESPSTRAGMTLPQFAQLMKAFNVETALNLDGGYSACQGVYNKQTMFTPRFIRSRTNERVLPCSIVAKEKSSHAKNKKEEIEVPKAPREVKQITMITLKPKRLNFFASDL